MARTQIDGRNSNPHMRRFASALIAPDDNGAVCPDPKDCPIPGVLPEGSLLVESEGNGTVCPDPKDCPIPEMLPEISALVEPDLAVCPDPKDCPIPA